ncbi:MAG: hypothetical protein NVS4B6_03980 [Mycobacterium sp.]
MTADQMGADEQVCGAPQPEPNGWGVRESLAAVVVAAVIAALGGAAIYAATDDGSHSFGAHHQPFGPGGGPFGPGGGLGGGAGGPGGPSAPGGPGAPNGQRGGLATPPPADTATPSLHGEFVVPDGGGCYTTVTTQACIVTAISPTSIIVRSVDGFRQTYVIPSTAGRAGTPFSVNDQVVVRATRNGQTETVTNIGNPQQSAPPRPAGVGGPPGFGPQQ